MKINPLQPLVHDQGVHLLNPGGCVRGNDNRRVAPLFCRATVFSREEHRLHSKSVRCLEAADDVGAVAAGAEGDQHVSRLP